MIARLPTPDLPPWRDAGHCGLACQALLLPRAQEDGDSAPLPGLRWWSPEGGAAALTAVALAPPMAALSVAAGHDRVLTWWPGATAFATDRVAMAQASFDGQRWRIGLQLVRHESGNADPARAWLCVAIGLPTPATQLTLDMSGIAIDATGCESALDLGPIVLDIEVLP